MLDAILKMKLHIPPASGVVPRPHLIARLNDSLQRRPSAVLLSAPAGFGKTTLVSQWLQLPDDAGAPAVEATWLSLDGADNDPVRFLSYLIAALQTLHPDLGQATLALLPPPPSLPLEALLTPLINGIADIESRFSLVLDDYHVIEAEPIHEAMTFLLDHLPPTLHLVMTSRSEPPLPLARWRGRGLLTELRAEELRFSYDEASQFLNEQTSLDLSPDEVALLDRRTEGWIVGLQLAALSLRGRSAPDRQHLLTALTGEDRYIADYLVEEVLQRQPPQLQTFLLRTAILDRLSGPLCNAVTERDDSRTVLEQLERANLFIVPLDNRREWYRYHHLFADLLRSRLRRSEPERVAGLHRRAATWYEANDQLSAAIGHALEGQDYDSAARWVARHARDMLKRGETATLRQWLRRLPPDIIDARPQLGVAFAWTVMLTGPVEALEPALQTAEAAIDNRRDDPPETRRALLAEIHSIRAIVSIERGDTSPANIEAAGQALADLPKDNVFLYSALATSLALAQRANGETGPALQRFTEVKSMAERSDNIFSILFVNYELAELQFEYGHLHQAEQLHRQSLNLVEQRFGQSARHIPLAGGGHIGLGKVLCERNDLEAARQQLERGLELAGQRGGMHLPRDGMVALARLHQAEGDTPGAQRWIQQAEVLARTAPRPEAITEVRLAQVRLWLAQGQLAPAQGWAEEISLAVDEAPAYADELAYLNLIRTYLALGNLDRLEPALSGLDHLRQRVESQKRWGRAIDILNLQAMVHQALGQSEQALAALDRSLSLAEPEGYLRRFVDEGPAMTGLLQMAASRSANSGYIQRLLKASGAALTPHPEAQPLVEPLTERELEVLNLIAAGLSNKAIAAELVITVGTVKRHTVNIYGKLGVNSRTQAVAYATELGLL